VSPQTFDKLLKHCDDYIVHSYINNLSSIFFCQIGFYSEYEMVQLINKDADDYVAKKLNGKIIKLFSEKYTNAKNAPKLLVDSDGKRIAEDDVTIFNNEDNKFSLPEWSKMRFINCELEKELCKEFSCNAKQLTKKLVPYGCKEYSFNNVIAHLEEQIKNDIQKTKDVFRWLYEIFKKQSISKYKNELPNSVNVISRTGKIIGSNECYFGKEYGNEIGERITSWLSNVNYVASCTELGFEESELDSVKTFLSQFGVGTFPIVKQVDYRNNTARDYQRYNCEKYPKLTADNGNDNGKKCECNDGKEGLFYHSDATSIRVADIKGVEEILKNADYKDILYWILKDSSNLKKRIESENEIDDESCMCGRPYKSKETKKVGKDQMRSWLRKKFTEAEWLPTKSGKKVNCFGCTIKPNELSPLIETLKIDYKGLAELMGKSSEQVKKDVESLFEKLGVAKDIANLPYKKVIKILQDLPNNDADCELGKKFYKELRGYFNKESTALSIKLNPEYNKFCINGKVLAEVNGNVEYFPIRDVFYVGNKINCQDIIKHYPIFILKNRGDEKIAQCFGIKSISEIGSIDVKPNIHPLNEKFVDEYKSLLPYIYAKLLDLIKKDKDDRELNLLKESQIILVENAVIQHIVRGQLRTGQLNDYELIYAGKVAYIKIPKDVTTLRELSANYDFVKNTAEAIIAILDIDVDKDSFAFIFSRSVRENERYFKDNLENVYLAKEKLNKQTDTNYFDDEDEEELLPAQNNGDNKDVARSEEIINDEDADDNQNGIKPNATKFNEKTYSGKLPESEQRRSYAGGVGYKRNRANYPNMTEDNQYIGFNAENAVYQVLVYKFGEKSVKWRSTNGSLAAKIGQGVDGLGYDISYIDAEGKQHYVEVKGTGTNILDFNLTKNEFEFGLKHKEEFEVWRVFNYENPDYEVFYEVYRIKKFDKIFDCKDIFNSPRFKVTQTINYSFKVK
jgi:hypothetical protein